jgi:hypothetical protein
MRNKFIRKVALVSAAALIGLGATACSSSSSSSSKSTKTSQTAKKKSKYSFDGTTAKLPGMTAKVDKVRFFNASEMTNNKKVIVFEYTITNTGKKSLDVNTAWIGHFNAYQPNKNTDGKLEVATTPMNYENILDNQDQKIKKGGHLNFVAAYELKSDTTAVTLKAQDILGEKTYGKHVYKLGTFENQKEV